MKTSEINYQIDIGTRVRLEDGRVGFVLDPDASGGGAKVVKVQVTDGVVLALAEELEVEA